MHTARVDITRMVTEIVTKMSSASEAKRTFDVQPGMDGYGDPTLLRIALFNLIQNACKFSPKGGDITVGQAADGSYFVKDEGIGFEQKYEKKMFLPFERLVTAAQFPGTGIGLANVKRIIERHGGRAWAESPGPGKGSCLRFTLPAQADGHIGPDLY
jgi:signal transduction histidine kinase